MAILCPDYKLLFIMVPGTGCSVIGKTLMADYGGQWLPEQPVRSPGGRVVVPRKHCSLQQLLEHGVLSQEQRRHLTVAATVRNPYDHLVTYYQRLAGTWTDDYIGFSQRQLDRDRPLLDDEEIALREAGLERRSRRLRLRSRLIRLVGFNLWFRRTIRAWHREDLAIRALDEPLGLDRLYPLSRGADIYLRYEDLNGALNSLLEHVGAPGPVALPRKNVTPGKREFMSYYAKASIHVMEQCYGGTLTLFHHSLNHPGDPIAPANLISRTEIPATP